MTYLDNAATTFVKPPEVYKAVDDALRTCGNSSRGGAETTLRADNVIFGARERVCELFGAESPEQVVFTHNATYALNIAIKGVIRRGNCVISGYEHNSVVRPIESMRKYGVTVSVARGKLFDREDFIKSFRNSIKKDTVCAVCTHVSNVFGYILPIAEVDRICFEKGIPLIIDASQSAGSIEIRLDKLKAAVCICAPGHKGLYGPQGTGVLVCREGEKLNTFIEGGTGSASSEMQQPTFMPDRLESGTHNTPGIAGLSAGVFYVLEKGCDAILEHEQRLILQAVSLLEKNDDLKLFYTKEKGLQGGVLSFISKSRSPDEIAHELSKREIAVRSGLHCSPLAHSTAGTTNGTTRVSVSDFTTERDVERLASALRSILR